MGCESLASGKAGRRSWKRRLTSIARRLPNCRATVCRSQGAPDFALCPLMLQVWAFRQIWPALDEAGQDFVVGECHWIAPDDWGRQAASHKFGKPAVYRVCNGGLIYRAVWGCAMSAEQQNYALSSLVYSIFQCPLEAGSQTTKQPPARLRALQLTHTACYIARACGIRASSFPLPARAISVGTDSS
jgi:hypothetical protein